MEVASQSKEKTQMTKYSDYVMVMTANGMHLTGKIDDAQSATFGRIELTDLLAVIVSKEGQLGFTDYLFRAKRITVYPVLIVKFADLEDHIQKAFVGAYVQKHTKIQLVQQ